MNAPMKNGTIKGAVVVCKSDIDKLIHKPFEFSFVGFEIFSQSFQLTVELHKFFLETILRDDLNCITESFIFRGFKVENFPRLVANHYYSMFANVTHRRGHTLTVDFDTISEAVISITYSYGIASSVAAFGFKFDVHTKSFDLIGVCIVDQMLFQEYTLRAMVNPIVRIGVLENIRAHNRVYAVFLCVKHGHIRIMVGRVGAELSAPGSRMTGYANPARLTTLEIGVSGGEFKHLSFEAAIMATIPPRFIFIFSAVRKNDPDAAPVYLHARTNTERQARKCHEAFYDLELIQCSRNSNSRRPHIIQEVSL